MREAIDWNDLASLGEQSSQPSRRRQICFKFIAKFNQKLILVKKLATTIAALARAFGCRAAFFKFFWQKWAEASDA